MESVSFFSEKSVIKIASDDKRYYKVPFLYLIASYMRNQAINWASEKYKFSQKIKTGSWTVYKFEKN